MILDIESMTAVLNDHPDDKLLLIRSEVNDRMRFTKSKKANGDQFDISNITSHEESKYEKRVTLYGFQWSTEVKGNRFAVPSLMEILSGLTQYLEKKLALSLKDFKQPSDIQTISEQYKTVFKNLVEMAGI